jgi:hypothetical protein
MFEYMSTACKIIKQSKMGTKMGTFPKVTPCHPSDRPALRRIAVGRVLLSAGRAISMKVKEAIDTIEKDGWVMIRSKRA